MTATSPAPGARTPSAHPAAAARVPTRHQRAVQAVGRAGGGHWEGWGAGRGRGEAGLAARPPARSVAPAEAVGWGAGSGRRWVRGGSRLAPSRGSASSPRRPDGEGSGGSGCGGEAGWAFPWPRCLSRGSSLGSVRSGRWRRPPAGQGVRGDQLLGR